MSSDEGGGGGGDKGVPNTKGDGSGGDTGSGATFNPPPGGSGTDTLDAGTGQPVAPGGLGGGTGTDTLAGGTGGGFGSDQLGTNLQSGVSLGALPFDSSVNSSFPGAAGGGVNTGVGGTIENPAASVSPIAAAPGAGGKDSSGGLGGNGLPGVDERNRTSGTGSGGGSGGSGILGDLGIKNPIGTGLALGGLGYAMSQGQTPPAYTPQMAGQAAKLDASGMKLMEYLHSGTLPAGLKTGLDNATKSAKTKAMSDAAARGLSADPTKNSALATQLHNIDMMATAQTARIGQDLLNSGLQEVNLSSSLYKSLAQIDQAQTQRMSEAIARMAAALNGTGGGNSMIRIG